MNTKNSIEKIVSDFKNDPRNKLFVDEDVLMVTASEETGEAITEIKIREVITAFLSGEMNDDQQSIYDGAVYACSSAARQCFGDDEDEDIDYKIDWLQQDNGSFVAEVRPN